MNKNIKYALVLSTIFFVLAVVPGLILWACGVPVILVPTGIALAIVIFIRGKIAKKIFGSDNVSTWPMIVVLILLIWSIGKLISSIAEMSVMAELGMSISGFGIDYTMTYLIVPSFIWALVVFAIVWIGSAKKRSKKSASSSIASRVRTAVDGNKYPIISNTFPVKAMSIRDKVLLEGIGECEYQGKFDGKYCIVYPQGVEVDGATYKHFTADELSQQATQLSNNRIVKWQKQ